MQRTLFLMVALALGTGCHEDGTTAAGTAADAAVDAVLEDGLDAVTATDATIPDTSSADIGQLDGTAADGQIWPWMAPCPLSSTTQEGVVATSAGWIRGQSSANGWSFLGIPFAAPPVGDLRWRAPVPPACWSEIRDAKQFAAACLQKDAKTGQPEGQEDCLTANVWTPKLTPAAPLPVLVFIHGGGNIQGSAADPLSGSKFLYAGHYLAAEGAVVVTIQYRLGALGWLSLPALDAAQGSPSGNYGLLDQQAALRWVQQNIGGFGGDPNRVLVFGESAGAVDVCSLLASPQSAGLFSAALMQSGGCGQPKLSGYQAAMASKVAKSSCGSVSDPLQCLRALSGPEVLSQLPGVIGVGDVTSVGDPGRYGPVVDGKLLPLSPIEALSAGSALQVPFVVGSNAEELAQLITTKVTTAAELEAIIAQTYSILGPSAVQQLQAMYAASKFASPQEALVQLFSDMRFVCPSRSIAQAARAGRAKSGSQAGVWRYWFSRQSPTKQAPLPAAHGLELLYVFGTMMDIPLYTPPPIDQGLTDAMRGYWTRLAGFASPNGPETNSAIPLYWIQYDSAKDNAIEFGSKFQMLEGIHTERCDLWDNLAAAATP